MRQTPERPLIPAAAWTLFSRLERTEGFVASSHGSARPQSASNCREADDKENSGGSMAGSRCNCCDPILREIGAVASPGTNGGWVGAGLIWMTLNRAQITDFDVRDLIAGKLGVARAKMAELEKLEMNWTGALRKCGTALRKPSQQRDCCPVLKEIGMARPQRKRV